MKGNILEYADGSFGDIIIDIPEEIVDLNEVGQISEYLAACDLMNQIKPHQPQKPKTLH